MAVVPQLAEDRFCKPAVDGSIPSGGFEVYNMSKKSKQRAQRRRVQYDQRTKPEPPDQEILDSIGSPNAWTPEAEDAWLKELRKIPSGKIHQQFPPVKKPSSVRKRGSGSGWGDNGT